jgi:cobalt-zinc-cadmium efflux system membrane fusion protein
MKHQTILISLSMARAFQLTAALLVFPALAQTLFVTGLSGCKPPAEAAAGIVKEHDPNEVLLAPEKVSAANLVIEPVAEQNVEDTIVTSGRVTFDDMRVAHVYSPVNGRVTQIFAQLGERVKKGQPLCSIQSPDIGQAVADVHKAEADFTAANNDYKRQKDLEKSHAAATRDVEAAEDRVRQAKAELERAAQKAALLRAGSVDTVTSTYTMASAIDGEVLMRAVNPGIEVQGQYSGGTAVELFTVGEIDHVWVLGDIYEVDIPRVKKDAYAAVRVVSYKDKLFEGKVEWVQHTLDPQTRTAKARFSFDNPGGQLLPEMYGTVFIHVDQRKALAITRSAILRLGDQRVVFVETGKVADGRVRFERRPIEVDEYGADKWLPILHGLEKGDRVVTNGAVLLTEM